MIVSDLAAAACFVALAVVALHGSPATLLAFAFVTTSAMSVPGEWTPAPAGQLPLLPVALLWSVSSANSAIGTVGSASVFQSTRHQLASGNAEL